MSVQDTPSHRPGLDKRSSFHLRIWRLTTLLLLLALIVSSVSATTVGQGPVTPLNGDTTVEEEVALVEFILPNRAAIDQLNAINADLAEYVNENEDGTITVHVIVTPSERAILESMGFQAGMTIEDQSTWEAAKAERETAIQAEQAAQSAAEDSPPPLLPEDESPLLAPMSAVEFDPGGEVTIMRVDYFTNYAGRFLAVSARTALGTTTGGPTLAIAWKESGGEYGSATTMSKYNDAGVYMYHRVLVRVGALGSTTPVPATVRVGSSTGEFAEAPVNTWVGGGLPPLADGYLKGFFTHYMDPTEAVQRFESLAAEFPELSEIINLPYLTNGYRRKAMAVMAGTTGIGSAPATAAQSQAVYLESKAWGHEGGNDVQAEFLNPGAPNSPLSVSVSGTRITVNLGTSSTGALNSTAAQVRDAINAHPEASALVTAATYGANAGNGIVQPRVLVNLSDFLNAPPSISREPFQNKAIRIGKQRDGSKVGVFLYCQQHAREWVTPLTCVETAERLLRNYAIDPTTKEIVDNLDIFILPSVNPDGGHYSFYNFNMQRRNMTRYCAPNTSSYMPSSRNSWGVDLNRNNTVGSLFDGYNGASTSCTSDTYAGPFEKSEPEIQNEHWIVDTFSNIKFANNIHTYGGYFMWSPGAYITPGRITLPHPNIGVESYFFAAADQVLNRIKEERGTVVLPERTGPIADVLYSAAGNSADDQWYRKDIIAYSFEAGSDRFTSTTSGTSQTAVGFQPNFATEGQYEALEFASGNHGLLEAALQYAFDNEPPIAEIVPNGGASQTPIRATFHYVNEPAVIYYTLDGSTPNLSSTTWEAQGPRRPGQVFLFNETTTIQWIAKDIKGNISEVRSARFAIDTDPPLLSPYVSPNPVLLYGSAEAFPNAVDNNSGVASASCDPLDTSSIGAKTVTCTATDYAGNTATATATYNVVYGFAGFFPPVENQPALNVANSGQTIPIKFHLTDAFGNPITNLTNISVTAVTLACPLGVTPDQVEEYAPGASGLLNLGNGNYQFNWKSPKNYANSCKTLLLDLGEGPGMQHTALFQFTR
ncbi:MAG: M14 family zinc carboxypeptidase [Anaerolineales bacterium]|nr:M14 family zinc carboxypeptidase [Anaerolineales bacterium]